MTTTYTGPAADGRADRVAKGPAGALRQRLRGLRQAYAPHEHRPLGGYALSMTTYTGLVAGLATAVRATGRPLPERPDPADVLLISVATHKLSRLLAKDAVTSPLRAPFTRYQEPIGHAEVAEEVRAEQGTTGHALGELLSCPFCLAMWIATSFTGGLVLAPRVTRLAATAFTAVAVSDFLQLAYGMAKKAADGPPDNEE
ncbi:MAG TPA: DUF1360 domain-containing protein [Pilimelia sp.]|nr:DUF1360 domain-containing protein [Pilimelia sp.]